MSEKLQFVSQHEIDLITDKVDEFMRTHEEIGLLIARIATVQIDRAGITSDPTNTQFTERELEQISTLEQSIIVGLLARVIATMSALL